MHYHLNLHFKIFKIVCLWNENEATYNFRIFPRVPIVQMTLCGLTHLEPHGPRFLLLTPYVTPDISAVPCLLCVIYYFGTI